MWQVPVRKMLRGKSFAQLRHVAPVTRGAGVDRVYREMEQEFGILAPPMLLHASSPPVLSAAWNLLRETLLVPREATRAEKETVMVTVSEANRCPYCVEVHSGMLTGLLGPQARPGRRPERVDALARWVQAGRDPEIIAAQPLWLGAPVGELIAVVTMMEYLNRVVSVFLGDKPLPPGAPPVAARVVGPVLARLQLHAERTPPVPGRALDLLPAAANDADPRADLGWDPGDDGLTEALRRVRAAIEAAGERSVPVGVRECVRDVVARWSGEAPPLGRAWLTSAVDGLPAAERAAGELGVLTALAAYRVEDATVAAFRAAGGDDAALVELTAWASLTAAFEMGRRTASRLGLGV
ncbi:carboxymuconolactone decarboxylase family protein [Kineosporia succinea]|uniref:Alkylhydroperoxidase family enzyme n=1 Tax=Kineosporia succinea TaxID=84632 RepID=A0ABT9PAY7_9ACTN|nr:carboxymuconolactone decarboxylase family protein [Kineosporia succinea]MDP9829652.1 alkylhydroperoxidase family enzyme [Kineosporia succinea]